MTQCSLLIDPAFFIWDQEDYLSDNRKYWKLISDLVDLIESIEELPFKFIFPSSLAEILINEFPASNVYDINDLRDVVSTIYSFLSRMLDNEDLPVQAHELVIQPSLCERSYFNAQLSAILKACIAHTLSNHVQSFLAAHRVVWSFSATAIKCSFFPDKEISICLEDDGYKPIKELYFREYEPHNKHHATYGYGSRLPEHLSDELIQSALAAAIELNNADTLCVKLNDFDTTLIFRRHERNKFHAYPISETEYSKYGVKLDLIPSV